MPEDADPLTEFYEKAKKEKIDLKNTVELLRDEKEKLKRELESMKLELVNTKAEKELLSLALRDSEDEVSTYYLEKTALQEQLDALKIDREEYLNYAARNKLLSIENKNYIHEINDVINEFNGMVRTFNIIQTDYKGLADDYSDAKSILGGFKYSENVADSVKIERLTKALENIAKIINGIINHDTRYTAVRTTSIGEQFDFQEMKVRVQDSKTDTINMLTYEQVIEILDSNSDEIDKEAIKELKILAGEEVEEESEGITDNSIDEKSEKREVALSEELDDFDILGDSDDHADENVSDQIENAIHETEEVDADNTEEEIEIKAEKFHELSEIMESNSVQESEADRALECFDHVEQTIETAITDEMTERKIPEPMVISHLIDVIGDAKPIYEKLSKNGRKADIIKQKVREALDLTKRSIEYYFDETSYIAYEEGTDFDYALGGMTALINEIYAALDSTDVMETLSSFSKIKGIKDKYNEMLKYIDGQITEIKKHCSVYIDKKDVICDRLIQLRELFESNPLNTARISEMGLSESDVRNLNIFHDKYCFTTVSFSCSIYKKINDNFANLSKYFNHIEIAEITNFVTMMRAASLQPIDVYFKNNPNNQAFSNDINTIFVGISNEFRKRANTMQFIDFTEQLLKIAIIFVEAINNDNYKSSHTFRYLIKELNKQFKDKMAMYKDDKKYAFYDISKSILKLVGPTAVREAIKSI